MSASKRTIAYATLAALVLMLPACNSAKESGQPQASPQVQQGAPTDTVERVNGKTISRKELDRAVKILLAQQQPPMPQPLPPETLQKARQAALDQLIATELLYQVAEKTQIKDLDQKVAKKIAQNRAKYATEADFQKTLTENGMTETELQEFARKDIVINEFIERQFASKATVSDAETKKFYDENKEKFKQDDGVRASHILIGADEKSTPEARKKAKEKALALLKKAKEGENFGALAKADSDCPSKSQGGDLGTFTKGQMADPFEKAAFALKVGQISELVETPAGYHIIKVTEKHAARTERYDAAKWQIQQYLKREKTMKLVSGYVAELRGKAKIGKG